jgi:ferredoxin
MIIQLRYFTGTGNSLKVISTIKDIFNEANHLVQISKITVGEPISQCDIIGFCFPVYAFGIPRIARQYLKKLPEFNDKQKAFIIITAGDRDESGFSIKESVDILLTKNCEIIYSGVIQMPINWLTAMNPPNEEEALKIINTGVLQVRPIAKDILSGVRKYHIFNIPKSYGKVGLYREYLLFKYLGIKNLWRTFKTYDTCNGCHLCAKACPTKSIVIKSKTPAWLPTCEQCMRCVNLCPNESIYQKYSGSTTGRNRYLEPDFKPLQD